MSGKFSGKAKNDPDNIFTSKQARAEQQSEKHEVTNWGLGKLQIPVDAKMQWNEFLNDSFDDQVEAVASSFFWQIQLPWINLPLEKRSCFWKEFSRDGCEHARDIATMGILYTNNIESLLFLKRAKELRDKSAAAKGDKKKLKMFLLESAIIGQEFSEIVCKMDHRLFRKFADIIKAGGIGIGTKGGEDSFNGQVLRDFCQLVSASRNLPTKKQLRESLGLTSEKPDSEKFRIALKELGLNGLPTAR